MTNYSVPISVSIGNLVKCNEYDITENGKYLGYYIEYFNHPLTGDKLDNTVFELYYDFDGEECLGSIVADSLNECLEYIR